MRILQRPKNSIYPEPKWQECHVYRSIYPELRRKERCQLTNPNQVAKLVLQQLGADKIMVTPVYRKPHPNWINTISYPRKFKTLDFAVFTGEDDQSTIEPIGQFIAQCGEIRTNEFIRLRLFPLSL